MNSYVDYTDYVENKLDTLEHSLTNSDKRERKLKRDILLARIAFVAMTIVCIVIFNLWVQTGNKKNELSFDNSLLNQRVTALESEISGYMQELEQLNEELTNKGIVNDLKVQNLIASYNDLTGKILKAYSDEASVFITEISLLKVENELLFKDNQEMSTQLDIINEALGKKIHANAVNAKYKTAKAFNFVPMGNFSVTGYSIYECPNQLGITSSGRKVKSGVTIAVDKSVIPHGSWVYIEGYGLRRADDTGGAIKGNDIDIFHDSYDDALSFGRKNLKVWLVDPITL